MKSIFARFSFILAFFCAAISLWAQSYRNPLDVTPALSANFGELRNNHFHSGLDYKTQGVENKPIYAIEDGYVSRISVSPWGYGLALYIDHPKTGHTSVYAHLNSFSKQIADYTTQKQYEEESYRVNLIVPAGLIPVKRGEQIALSGNTGGSSGPHLHFEIRDTKTEEPIDPLNYFSKTFVDTQKPNIQAIAFYPVNGEGSVNNASSPLRIGLSKSKSGALLPIKQAISAWGKIGIAVKAYDKMNGQNNVYGVKYIRLFVDGKQTFGSKIDRFPFDKTRMLNSFIDFEDWRLNRSFYMCSFVEPGNTLPFYSQEKDNGYIMFSENQKYAHRTDLGKIFGNLAPKTDNAQQNYDSVNDRLVMINEERNYDFRYELEDYYGNIAEYSFSITGKQQEIPKKLNCKNEMIWNMDNSVSDTDFSVTISKGNLYKNFCFEYEMEASTRYNSIILRLNKKPIPLQNNATIWLKLKTDNKDFRSKYGVMRVTKNGGGSWIGGNYKNGGMEFTVNELGHYYAISIDTIAPIIAPIEPASWVSRKRIRIRLSDNNSGVNQIRGTINGKFVLFTNDSKSNIYTYQFDNNRLERGVQRFVFTVTDGAGNKSEYRKEFNY